MADEQNKSAATDGQGDKAPTQEQTISMASYKKLQGDLQKAQEKVKEFEKRDREGLSVEQQLAEAREQLAETTRELKKTNIKRTAPESLHDWIDTQFDKGRELDSEDIEALVERMTDTSNKSEKTEEKKSEAKEKSGVRNSAPKTPNSDEEADELLKKTSMREFFR